MPTKHIDNESWKIVESLTVKAVEVTGTLVKESDVFRLLIETGARHVSERDLKDIYGFKPGYGVMCWNKEGVITDFGTVTPEEYASHYAANQPLMTGVYGHTATGKTEFKNRLLSCLAAKHHVNEPIKVLDDDDGYLTENDRNSHFKSFFEDGESVIFVEHASNCSSMITKFVNSMAKSKVNFLFSGEDGEGRKKKIDLIKQVMRNEPEFTYVGKSGSEK